MRSPLWYWYCTVMHIRMMEEQATTLRTNTCSLGTSSYTNNGTGAPLEYAGSRSWAIAIINDHGEMFFEASTAAQCGSGDKPAEICGQIGIHCSAGRPSALKTK